MNDTSFSTHKDLVMQIHSASECGGMNVNGIIANRKEVHVFIPKEDGTKIFCPLNYFQDSCSLDERWIINDHSQKIPLDGIEELERVTITNYVLGQENKVILPEIVSTNLLFYFKDNLSANEGFDCHAFVCFLINIKCTPKEPNFNYFSTEPNIGDIVCLCTDDNLPNSIKHWAMYLGNDNYISKFGESTRNTDSHVAVMSMENMHSLYRTNNYFVAEPIATSDEWDGNFRRASI